MSIGQNSEIRSSTPSFFPYLPLTEKKIEKGINDQLKNIQWEKKESIFSQWKKPRTSRFFTPLELAVKENDFLSASNHISDPLDAKFSKSGSIVHFFMDCLAPDKEPDFNLLNLLLTKVDIDREDRNGNTPLERAIINMGSSKKIHWKLIDELLKKGSRVTNPKGVTPFIVLKDTGYLVVDTQNIKEKYANEIAIMDNLIHYLYLERKYHPDSKSSLSLHDFKMLTPCINFQFTTAANIFNSSVFNNSKSLLEEQVELLMSPNPEELLNSHFEISKKQLRSYLLVKQQILTYHNWFIHLVRDVGFSECFYSWQIKSFIRISRETGNHLMGSDFLNTLHSVGLI